MPILIGNAVNSAIADPADPQAWNHTVASNERRILMVGLSLAKDGADAINGVTVGGFPATRIATVTQAAIIVELWYYLNPPVGTNNISVDLSRSYYLAAGSLDLGNVNTSNPIRTHATAQGVDGNGPDNGLAVVTVNSSLNDLVIGAFGNRTGNSVSTTGTDHIQRLSESATGGDPRFVGTSKEQDGKGNTTTLNWTISGGGTDKDFAIIAAVVRPYEKTGFRSSREFRLRNSRK